MKRLTGDWLAAGPQQQVSAKVEANATDRSDAPSALGTPAITTLRRLREPLLESEDTSFGLQERCTFSYLTTTHGKVADSSTSAVPPRAMFIAAAHKRNVLRGAPAASSQVPAAQCAACGFTTRSSVNCGYSQARATHLQLLVATGARPHLRSCVASLHGQRRLLVSSACVPAARHL